MTTRRTFLRGAGALGVAAASARRAWGQGGAIKLGTLTPLTGAGGAYGPSMLKSMQWVVGEVNAAGGVAGRQLQLVTEDGQTNPDAAVRAARKLIDVDRVAAIMGTWASAVTTAVAPLCWESKTFLTTVSGSDTITLLPHQGYLVRTQPNTVLQGKKFAEFMAAVGAKRVVILAVQSPFAQPVAKWAGDELKRRGAELLANVIYDKDKTTYRSEIDQALRGKPDMIFLNGYTPDVTIVMKDLYKAGYTGMRMAPAYAVNQKFLEAMPQEVTEGTYTIAPSPNINSTAYKRLTAALGNADLDPYSCQTHDHVSLVTLAIAHAKGDATGTVIKDHVRKISQGSGAKVESAVEGLKLLAQGKAIDFDGASGPCEFNEIGDILDTKFRYEQVEKGKFKLLKIA
jgi:ABC-type branched-subunit amino acid transport system substrate-binding protein